MEPFLDGVVDDDVEVDVDVDDVDDVDDDHADEDDDDDRADHSEHDDEAKLLF